MIADADFEPRRGGVRRLRFAPRASIPIEAACVVANGVRETLRELLGEACELVLGAPAVLALDAWPVLARDALLFLTRGRQTDVVLVLPRPDARRLVLRAFGEADARGETGLPDAACSALELHALERIAARCARAFDPLCAERRDACRAVGLNEIPPCVAYFDLRLTAPIALTLGIGIVRDLPEPGPAGALSAALLEEVTVEARAVFAEGTIDAASFVRLCPGDVVKLDTTIGAPAFLRLGDRRLAAGTPGAVRSRTALLVHDVALGAHHP
jgi:flagellar motor switch/type III secretory pathway protein FliN